MPSILQGGPAPGRPGLLSPAPPPVNVGPAPATGPGVSSGAAPPGPAPGPETRPFGEPDAVRKAIYDNALQAAQGIQPVSNTRYSMELHDVGWAGPDRVGLAEQKKAILE